jgi:N-acetylmuramoyl-L-alanine amidase
MSLIVKQNLVSSSKYSIKCPYFMAPTEITVHNTGSDASAENEIKYMITNDQEVSFHYAVDDIQALQGVPLDRNTWNAGDGQGKGNRESIAVEICYSKSGGPKFDKSEANAATLIAQLMQKYKIPISKVKRHYDRSGKNCPERTMQKGWQRFLDMVQKAYDLLVKPATTSTPTQTKADKSFKVGTYEWPVITTDNLNVRSGRGTSFKILKTLPRGSVVKVGYIMWTNSQPKSSGNNDSLWGNTVLGDGTIGFICLDYAKPV